ncbi:MAG TPA: tetratricopeptide repeat protein [Thermoanaerobaculia bacterium]|nr:tetratricopeptide repeat protein [Thermoanaerobaculia bacterium]
MKAMLALFLAVGMSATGAMAQEQSPSDPYDFLMAKLAADEGRYDEALSRIEKVIGKDPQNPVLLFERAMILMDAGRLDRAEPELRRLVAKSPDFYDAQRVLGRVLLDRAGNDRAQVAKALDHLHAAFRINPDDLATGVTVAQLLVFVGRPADAERVLAVMVERSPDQRVLNFQYAQVLTKLGRGDESKPYLERAVVLDPTFGPAIFQLVDIYQKQSEWTKAAEIVQPLIEEDPLNIDLRRQQAYFYLRAGNPEKARTAFSALVEADPLDARSLFYLAEALNDLEQYAEADKIYRRLLERTPDDPDLLASFGLAQSGQRHFDEAETTFKSLLRLPDLPDNLVALAQTQLAYIELERGNLGGAIDTARPLFIFRDRPNVQAINIALDALRREKKYTDAIALLQPLADRFSSDPFLNARLVEFLLRAGDRDQARTVASTQVKFGTRNVIATAEAHIQAGDFPTAITLVTNALESKPDDVDLLFELGSVQERNSDHAAAEKAFLRILEKHPDHAATLNYLGYMWADRNVNLERAAEMLVRAVEQEPRNGAYVDSLGWVYFRLGKLDLAEKYLSDAARLLPRDPTIQEHLADVMAKRGNYARALELYRTALQLDREGKEGEKLRSKIAEVERQTQR